MASKGELVPAEEVEVTEIDEKQVEKKAQPEKLSIMATLTTSFLKESDQMSPLLLKKMPLFLAFLVGFLLFSSYLIGFFIQLAALYGNCSQENDCISCAITLEEVDGADCDRLATTQLAINAGCTSFPIANNWTVIDDVLKNINLTIQRKEGEFTDDFYTSLVRHGEIVKSVRSNPQNQMVDPNPDEVRNFLGKYFVGYSDGLNLAPNPSDDGELSLSDDLAISAGLKILYSYITIGCVINSVEGGDNIESITADGTDYTTLKFCPCSIQCPSNTTIVGGLFDVSKETGITSNGLQDVTLALPDNYVQVVDYNQDPPFSDALAVGEMVYYTAAANNRRRLQDANDFEHCATSVFTSTPSKLNGVLFECCQEKTDLEKLSEMSAFASLVLTFAVVVTTILFWPCSPNDKSLLDVIDNKVEKLAGEV